MSSACSLTPVCFLWPCRRASRAAETQFQVTHDDKTRHLLLLQVVAFAFSLAVAPEYIDFDRFVVDFFSLPLCLFLVFLFNLPKGCSILSSLCSPSAAFSAATHVAEITLQAEERRFAFQGTWPKWRSTLAFQKDGKWDMDNQFTDAEVTGAAWRWLETALGETLLPFLWDIELHNHGDEKQKALWGMRGTIKRNSKATGELYTALLYAPTLRFLVRYSKLEALFVTTEQGVSALKVRVFFFFFFFFFFFLSLFLWTLPQAACRNGWLQKRNLTPEELARVTEVGSPDFYLLLAVRRLGPLGVCAVVDTVTKKEVFCVGLPALMMNVNLGSLEVYSDLSTFVKRGLSLVSDAPVLPSQVVIDTTDLRAQRRAKRTPEERANAVAKFLASRALLTPEQHEQTKAKMRAAFAKRSPEERARISAQRQQTFSTFTPAKLKAIQAKRQASLAKRTPQQKADSTAKRRAMLAARTPQQLADFADKWRATRAQTGPLSDAARATKVAKQSVAMKAFHASHTPEKKAERAAGLSAGRVSAQLRKLLPPAETDDAADLVRKFNDLKALCNGKFDVSYGLKCCQPSPTTVSVVGSEARLGSRCLTGEHVSHARKLKSISLLIALNKAALRAAHATKFGRATE